MSSDASRIGRMSLITLALKAGITGRTKLQKILYLANLSGWNVISDYQYHHYGPYSEMISMIVEDMRNNGWVKETPYGTDKNVVYKYFLEKEGIKRELALAGKQDSRLVKRTESLVKELNKFSSDDLEIMSTLVFIREEDKSLSDEQLVKTVAQLKPRFDIQQVKENLKIFKILRNFRR